MLNTSHESITIEDPHHAEEAKDAEEQRHVKGALKQHEKQWQKKEE